jgi:hypothetical protein
MCSSVTLLRLSAALVFLYAVISWVLFTGLWLLSGDVASLKLGGVKVLTFVASPVDAVVVYLASEAGGYAWHLFSLATTFVAIWCPLSLMLAAHRKKGTPAATLARR